MPGKAFTNQLVDSLCLRRTGRLAGAYRPDWLVGYDHVLERIDAAVIDHRIELRANHSIDLVGFTLIEGFTHTQNGSQPSCLHRLAFQRDRCVGFTKQGTTLRVANNDIATAVFRQHARGYFTGKSASRCVAAVLRAKRYIGLNECLTNIIEMQANRTDNHLARQAACTIRDTFGERDDRIDRSVEFPVTCDNFLP